MKKIFLVVVLTLVMVIPSFAFNDVAGKQADTATDVSMAVAIIVTPITCPAQMLAAPYQGLKSAYNGTEKIQNEAGRNAVRVALAPLWVPAVVLNIPSALISMLGLTNGY